VGFKQILELTEGRKFGEYKGLDYLALTALMRVAEKQVGGDHDGAGNMKRYILEEEDVSEKVIDEIIEEIKQHTVLKGTFVYNKDPKTGKLSRRYAPD